MQRPNQLLRLVDRFAQGDQTKEFIFAAEEPTLDADLRDFDYLDVRLGRGLLLWIFLPSRQLALFSGVVHAAFIR